MVNELTQCKNCGKFAIKKDGQTACECEKDVEVRKNTTVKNIIVDPYYYKDRLQ